MITTDSTPRPADFADVRATNLAVVLRHVRANAPCSRADIAAATGLNKATVSSLVADLIERRMLRETGVTENRIGRPATMLVLDGQPYAAIGLEVGADHLTVVALDLAGTRLLTWRRAFDALDATPGRAVAAIAALVNRATARICRDSRQVLGLAVGVPGLVDAAGNVRLAAALRWRDVDLREQLTRALRQPAYAVEVDSDANLAVLAEQRYGPYAATTDLVHLTCAVGVRAGVLAGGRLLRGGRGLAGELGHVRLDPTGPDCDCGRRGCLDAYASLPALVRAALPDGATDGPVVDFAPELAEVRRRAAAEDKTAVAALAEAGRRLGQGAAILANVLDPEVIVLGGHLATLDRWLLPSARAELASLAVTPRDDAALVASTLGTAAVAAGGAARVLDGVDVGQLPAPRVAAG